MNERITLRFREYDPELAHWLLDVARSFAVTFINRQSGVRCAVGYSRNGWKAHAYWTRARAVVVVDSTEEVSNG